ALDPVQGPFRLAMDIPPRQPHGRRHGAKGEYHAARQGGGEQMFRTPEPGFAAKLDRRRRSQLGTGVAAVGERPIGAAPRGDTILVWKSVHRADSPPSEVFEFPDPQ